VRIGWREQDASYDEVAKVDGAWKFTHRLFVPFLIATGTVVGDVVTSRPLVSRDSADVSSQARFQRSSSGAEAGTLRSVLCPS